MTFAAEVKWTWDSGAAVLEERAVAVEGRLSVEAEMPEVGVAHLKGMCAYKHEEGNVENKQISMWRNGFCYEERLFRPLLCKKKKIREILYLTVVSLEFLWSISLPLQRSPAAPPKGSHFNVLYFST